MGNWTLLLDERIKIVSPTVCHFFLNTSDRADFKSWLEYDCQVSERVEKEIIRVRHTALQIRVDLECLEVETFL